MAVRTLISVRLDPEAVALLDAWATYRHATGRCNRCPGMPTRTDVIEALLLRLEPPEDFSQPARDVRDATKRYRQAMEWR